MRGATQANYASNNPDLKYPATIVFSLYINYLQDIRFDKRNQIDLIKDEALLKYQENVHLFVLSMLGLSLGQSVPH